MRLVISLIVLVTLAQGASCSDHWEPAAVGDPVAFDGDRTLAVFVGTCSEADVDVEQTSEAVRLTAQAEVTDADDESSCGGEVITVRLDEALGHRPVIDTSTDAEVEVVRCRPADPEADQPCAAGDP